MMSTSMDSLIEKLQKSQAEEMVDEGRQSVGSVTT
jgi:hypothetical protein